MRFTKIPLIATLMAVALSLLIVLPTLAQSSGYDDTRGTQSSGSNLTVQVLSTPDDPGTDGTDEAVMANSYFNRTLYVSNDDDAHNTVRISATGGTRSLFNGPDGVELDRDRDGPDATGDNRDESGDNILCAVATVKNNRSGKSIEVVLGGGGDATTTTPSTEPELVQFKVVTNGLEEENNGTRVCGEEAGQTLTGQTEFNTDTLSYDDVPSTEAKGAVMPARHGDTLTITVAGVAGSVRLTVDADGPEFTEISPDDGAKLSSQTVKIRFVVTDEDSGLAHDGELAPSPDTDPEAVNTDGDNFTFSEPRSEVGGAARDIEVVLDTVEKSADGNSGWRDRGSRPGVSYFLDMAITNVDPGSNPWYLEATDRAGNTARTDADPGEDDDQDFTLVVDVSSPEFRDARTGISYDPDDKKEIVDRSFIAVTFEDIGGPDAVMNVDADKFLVEDAEVVGVIHLSDKSDCDNTDSKEDQPLDIDGGCLRSGDVPASRIYLELAEPLAPDATPLVSMFGGAALDLAGNPSNQDEILAADNIAPAITVTVTTEVTGRPVIKRNDEVTVTITSDEELRRLPAVFFAEVLDGETDAEEEDADLELGSIRRGDRVQSGTDALSWSRTYSNSDVGGRDGLYAVVIIAEDDADNVGTTPGWSPADRRTKTPAAGNGADLDDLTGGGLAVEIDTGTSFNSETPFSLSPQSDDDETESNNPFITIDFGGLGGEAGEYDTSTKRFKSDSHSAVEIVSITLNGNDVSGDVADVESNKYTLAAKDLAIGEYELDVTGRDEVGNEVSDTYEFAVTARGAYKVNLTPGWNLVSVPGTPLDSSIQAVMGDTMQATIVLAYQDDAWLTSVNDNGTWRGTLTDIVGGYGYWVQTTAFEAISALIPETDTSTVLPTASVIKGWNLLGVVDVLQNKAGSAPSGGGEADNYFDNFDWKVAYSFDTETNSWEKSIPDEDEDDDADSDKEILNGKGYWVWSTEAGTLVP